MASNQPPRFNDEHQDHQPFSCPAVRSAAVNADWTGGPDHLLEADEQRRDVARRFRATQVPVIKLWTYYYGLGGDADEVSLDAYLNEALHLPAAQVGLIDTAMRELSAGEDQ